MADLARPVNRAGGAGQGTQAVIRKHSHDLPIGLRTRRGQGTQAVIRKPSLDLPSALATDRATETWYHPSIA